MGRADLCVYLVAVHGRGPVAVTVGQLSHSIQLRLQEYLPFVDYGVRCRRHRSSGYKVLNNKRMNVNRLN